MQPGSPSNTPSTPRTRDIVVPVAADGMRLDQFLARRFRDFSRTRLARGIKAGEVCHEGRVLRAGTAVREGQILAIAIPGIAPSGTPPPFPAVLHEAEGLWVVDKPAGMLCHPTGSAFVWALIGLAKDQHPAADLVHRIDRDTSGCVAMTTDPDLNRHLKAALKRGDTHKEYEAIVKGEIPWESRTFTGPIGPAGGRIRIQMAVNEAGKSARTDVWVVERQPGLTRVRCRIFTGRTHQIRVHLATAGFPLLGDRMYGVPPEIFLHSLDHGADPYVVAGAGAPRHALHAAQITLPMPTGRVTITAPWPEDLARWWRTPSVLPHDGKPQ